MKSNLHSREIFALTMALSLFFIVTLIQLRKPLITDEIIYPQVATSLKERGTPLYKMGENIVLLEGHPPLFAYSIAFMYALGLDVKNVRLIPLLFVLATIVIIYDIGKKLAPKGSGIPLLSVILYVIGPLTIQSALLMDIDNSIMTFLVTLFAYALLFSAEREKKGVLPGLLLGLAFFSKVVTPLLLVPSLFVHLMYTEGCKKGAVRCTEILGTALATFLILWAPYTMSSGVSIFGPFTYFSRVGGHLESFGAVKYLLVGILYGGLKIHIFWLTPAYFCLVLLALGQHFRRFAEHRTFEGRDFIAFYSTTIFAFYLLVGQSPWKFPKYVGPALPGFAILVAFYLNSKIGSTTSISKKDILPYLAALSAPPIFHFLFLRDPLIPPHSVAETAEVSLLYALPPLLTFSIFYVLMRRRLRLETIGVMSLAVVFLSTALYLDYVQLNADYSTIYNYGEGGFKEAAEYLESHTSPEDLIVAPNDIARSICRDYLEVESEMNSPDCGNIFLKREVSHVILRGDWDMKYHPALFKCLRKNYEEVNFGNFYIYDVKKD